MRIRIAVPERHVTAPILNAALEATTRANEAMIASGDTPLISPLIRSGAVRWRPEGFNDGEHFDLGETVVSRGWGDCDDLAPHLCAEIRHTGRDPGARAIVQRSGPKMWHAVVRLTDGTILDPSRAAGMGKRGAALQGSSVMGTILPGDVGAVLGVKKHGNRWAARCDLPVSGTDTLLSGLATASTPYEAAADALEGAAELVGEDTGLGYPEDVARAYAVRGAVLGVDFNELLQGVGDYIDGDELGRLYDDVQGTMASLIQRGAIAASKKMRPKPGSVGDLVRRLEKMMRRAGASKEKAAKHARIAAKQVLSEHQIHGADDETVGSLFGSLLKSAVSILPIPGAGLVSNLLPDIDPFKKKGGGAAPGAPGAPGAPNGGGGGGGMGVRVTKGPHGAVVVSF